MDEVWFSASESGAAADIRDHTADTAARSQHRRRSSAQKRSSNLAQQQQVPKYPRQQDNYQRELENDSEDDFERWSRQYQMPVQQQQQQQQQQQEYYKNQQNLMPKKDQDKCSNNNNQKYFIKGERSCYENVDTALNVRDEVVGSTRQAGSRKSSKTGGCGGKSGRSGGQSTSIGRSSSNSSLSGHQSQYPSRGDSSSSHSKVLNGAAGGSGNGGSGGATSRDRQAKKRSSQS